MLIQFKTNNFFSFKADANFCMAKSSSRGPETANVTNTGFKKLDLLKSACIYGANASGKTNLLWALYTMQRIVLASADEHRGYIYVVPFKLNEEAEKLPSHFEVSFIVDNELYRYGFEADRQEIKKEWLFGVINKKEIKYFERTLTTITPTEHFKEGDRSLQEKTRADALFISVVAQFNGTIATKVVNWFRSLQFIGMGAPSKKTEPIALTPQGKNRLMQFMKAADVGIEDVLIRTIAENDLPPGTTDDRKRLILRNPYDVYMTHKQYDKDNNHIGSKELPMYAESDGTKQLFNMFGYICKALDTGGVLVIDELESNLHPLILEFIIKQFNCPENKNAQLIFTTHDLNLLRNDIFRRDQIWFTEKDSFGATQLFSLVEFQGIRQNTNFAKYYKLGKFKAIPNVDQFYRFKPEML